MLAVSFGDPVIASQAVFRLAMNAMARPGTITHVPGLVRPPAPLGAAAGAVALTLLDYDTPVWLDHDLSATPEVAAWLHFHTGAPLTTDPRTAAFAFVADTGRMPGFEMFAQGTMEYPDRSTTLVLQLAHLSEQAGLELAGPGIAGTKRLSGAPLPADFRVRLIANRALFPRGLDLVLTTDDAVAALPRSVRIVTEHP